MPVAQPPALSTPYARRGMRVLSVPSGRRAQGGARRGTYRIIDRQFQELDILINFWTDSKIFTRHTPL